jgi:hypothetical protein
VDFENIKQQFINNCNKGFCQRKTIKSKNCLKDYKQELCFNKHMKQIEKDSFKVEDKEWKDIQVKVKERDKTCLIDKCLVMSELLIIKNKYSSLYYTLGKTLDCAHIIPRSEAPHLIYDLNNIILIKRIYHSMLDQSINFFDGKYEKGFREEMINRIMHSNKLWNDKYNYQQFKKDKGETR